MLEDELAEKQRTIDRQHAEIDEQKRRYEAEIERLKTELANLETKYQNELEDERDRHSHVCVILIHLNTNSRLRNPKPTMFSKAHYRSDEFLCFFVRISVMNSTSRTSFIIHVVFLHFFFFKNVKMWQKSSMGK